MSVSKRPDVKTDRGKPWRARFWVTQDDGKRVQKSANFRTKSEAQAWERDMRAQVAKGVWRDPSGGQRALVELFPKWLDGKATITPKTRENYTRVWEGIVAPRWAHVRASAVRPSDVRVWLATLTGVRGKAAGDSLRRQAFVVLSGVLDVAVLDGGLPTNPARDAYQRKGDSPFKQTEHKRRRYLTAEEVEAVADAVGDHYRPFILASAYTGLRWGEITALRVEDVDLLHNRLRVRRAASRVSGGVHYGLPKTKRAREVPLPRFLRADIEARMYGRAPEDLLFTTPQGAPMDTSNFRTQVLAPAAKRAGLAHLTHHDFRHTAASIAVAAGADVKVLQSMLGHKSATMTLNVYSDLMPNRLDEVEDAMTAARMRAVSGRVEAGLSPDRVAQIRQSS